MNNVIPITDARSARTEPAENEGDRCMSAPELVDYIRENSDDPEMHIDMMRGIMEATRP